MRSSVDDNIATFFEDPRARLDPTKECGILKFSSVQYVCLLWKKYQLGGGCGSEHPVQTPLGGHNVRSCWD